MALSNYSYWDSFHQTYFNAETSTIFAQEDQTSHEQLCFSELEACSDYIGFADYSDHDLFNHHNMLYSISDQNYDYLPGILPAAAAHFQQVVPAAKRQKYFGAYGLIQDYPQEVSLLLPDPPILAPPVLNYNMIGCDTSCVKKRQQQHPATSGGGGGGGGGLSAQSVAARQRRRKITDKTQQLGKLIPGGQKMNTAEMFGAAHKYINFLQAQVGILEFMTKSSCHQEDKESSFPEEEEHYYNLHDLLQSPLIQEKLFSAEKCLVPKKFVQSLNTVDLDPSA